MNDIIARFFGNALQPFVVTRFVPTLLVICFSTSVTWAAERAGAAWWQFRGPTGDGWSSVSELPTQWDEEKNIAWKTKVHDRGWSSPVVWDDQIWVTTATEAGHKLYAVCIDKNSGKIVHDLHLFDVEDPMRITNENTYATPTPVIEKGRVFVHFGTYGTACIDTNTGEKLWTRRDLNCDHEANAGPASSPTIIDGNLVVHVDGRDVQYIVALDRKTGDTVWKTLRSIDFADIPVHHRKAFCMPTAIGQGDAMQIVSPGGRAIYSYDRRGNEIWRVQHRGFSVAPRPVFGHGLVFATIDRDDPELWAIRVDGKGDVTNSHVAWKETRGMPQRCSPLLIDDLLYLVSRDGIATCLEAKTGELVWKKRLEGRYSASPLYAQGLIYLFNEEAKATLIRPGRKFEVAHQNALAPDQLRATPAIVDNALIVRTENFLYRIEAGAKRIAPEPMVDVEVATNPFVGRWDIGRSSPEAKPAFVMTLNADFTARKSHVPSATGTWKLVDGEARVVWSDGWRDVIREQGDGYRKIAFGPGRDFDDSPSNQDNAQRAK